MDFPDKLNEIRNKNISNEKRLDIIKVLENATNTRKSAAEIFNVSYSSVVRIYNEYCQKGKIAKSKVGGVKPKKLSPEKINFIKNLLIEDCGLTLKEMKSKVLENFGISVCEATISKYVDSFNFSIKRMTKISNASITENLIEIRKTYSSWFLSVVNEGRKIIFIDETGFMITMRKYYGRSEKGKKAICITPGIKSRNKTIMACMWKGGMLHYKAQSEAGNRVSFLKFINELTVILTTKEMNNVIMIMDNVSFHKCSEIADFVVSKGHSTIFLPPYSPFFNPIEFMFSQWKSIVRSQKPTTDMELMQYIDGFQNVLSEDQCENYVRHVVDNAIKCLSGINLLEE